MRNKPYAITHFYGNVGGRWTEITKPYLVELPAKSFIIEKDDKKYLYHIDDKAMIERYTGSFLKRQEIHLNYEWNNAQPLKFLIPTKQLPESPLVYGADTLKQIIIEGATREYYNGMQPSAWNFKLKPYMVVIIVAVIGVFIALMMFPQLQTAFIPTPK